MIGLFSKHHCVNFDNFGERFAMWIIMYNCLITDSVNNMMLLLHTQI
jgi:hypothetical protein